MIIALLKESVAGESRVAGTPETVKKYISLGFEVLVQKGAGEGASLSDATYKKAGAKIVAAGKALVGKADIILGVRHPSKADTLKEAKKGAIFVAMLDPYDADAAKFKVWAKSNLTLFAMELMPRITRAQTMDVLSSQSNLAGYKAVIDAASEYDRAFPMMMTAAGTVAPAKVLIMGAGVAGLQAIATAKRLGAIVLATDVRMAAKEQVESLGGKFVMVDGMEDMETEGGYAKEASEDFKRRQAEKIHETVKKMDIVITTALIPGRPAPMLISEQMVKDMPEGSIVLDMAVERGGNCALSEADKTVVKYGVKIMGQTNIAGGLARDASQLYAKNLLNFLTPMIGEEGKGIKIDFEDETVSGTCLTHNGKIVHPQFKDLKAAPKKEVPKKAAPKKKTTAKKAPVKAKSKASAKK